MTAAVPLRAIVVCDDPQLHAFLAASTDWDLQHPVPSVAAMWADLEASRLASDRIGVVVLAPTDPAERDDVIGAAATLSPFAPTVIVTWGRPVEALTIRGEVEDEIRRTAEDNPSVDPSSSRLFVVTVKDAAEAARAVVEAAQSSMPWLAATPAAAEAAPASTPDPQAPATATPTLTAPTVAAAPGPPLAAVPAPAPTPAPAPEATVVAVTSVAGGTGTTTVALLLAATAAQASRAAGDPLRVLVVDLDDRDGVHAADLTGGATPSGDPLAGLVLDTDAVHRHLIESPTLGIDVLPAAPPPDTDLVTWLADVIDLTRRTHDVVVLDLPSHAPAAASASADRVVLLCPMSLPALAATNRRVRAAGRDAATRTVLVLNPALPGVGVDVAQAVRLVPGVRLGSVLVSAATDVQLAINHQALHRLVLDHPTLAPALLELTHAALPAAHLAPASAEMGGTAPTPASRRGRRRGGPAAAAL